jgi:type IV pilus assembly protein PilX
MALIFVLVIMSMVMVVVTITSRLALLSERSARNDRDRQIALEAADAALNDAEMDIMDPTKTRGCKFANPDTPLLAGEGCATDAVSRGLCGLIPSDEAIGKPIYKSINWDDTGTTRGYVNFGEFTSRTFLDVSQVGKAGTPVKAPKYIIYQPIPKVNIALDALYSPAIPAFKIYALGYGANQQTQVLLEATILKPLPSNQCL